MNDETYTFPMEVKVAGRPAPEIYMDESEHMSRESFEACQAAASKPTPRNPIDAYLEKVAEFNAHHVCDQVEHMLGPAYKDCRQARRKFKRTVEKHWPLKPDAKRHPRTTLFVSRYEAMIKEAQERSE